MISILDVKNVSIMDLRGDALEFLKAASRVVQLHYVERSHKMFILNAPSWFSVLWKVKKEGGREGGREGGHFIVFFFVKFVQHTHPPSLPSLPVGHRPPPPRKHPQENQNPRQRSQKPS